MRCAVQHEFAALYTWPCRIPFIPAGGELNFVYGIREDQAALWARSAPHPEQPDHRNWQRPDDDLENISFAGRLVDSLLSGIGYSTFNNLSIFQDGHGGALQAPRLHAAR